MDRIDVEVEFPERSRTHNTSKDTGLCGRFTLVILMPFRARQTIPPWLTKLSDVSALREIGRTCSTIEPPGGMIAVRQVSDNSSMPGFRQRQYIQLLVGKYIIDSNSLVANRSDV